MAVRVLFASERRTVPRSGVTATATFVDQNGGGCVSDNQFVRLHFTSPAGAGPSFPLPGANQRFPFGGTPSGYYGRSWWSNLPTPAVQLTGASGGGVITAPLSPATWSDWNGQAANSSPAVTAAFNESVADVKTVGLSFGGGCFFENGVTTSDGSGTFTLNSFSVS